MSGTPNIAVGQGGIDVRLRNLTVEGGGEGIIIYEHSQVSLAQVTGRDPGYTPLGVYDASDVHVEDCLFEHSTGEAWHAGIDVGSGHVTIHGTTIRNMQVGMNITSGGQVDVNDFNTYYPFGGLSDVVIENPAGTNYYGVNVQDGGALLLGSAKLRVANAGQSWGGDTAGVRVIDGSTLSAGPNLVVSGSQGHGVYVANNSHATWDGSHIDSSQHGGLVAVNLSTIPVTSLNPPTAVGGNAGDLFCDSRSVITGALNIGDASTVQCPNFAGWRDGSDPLDVIGWLSLFAGGLASGRLLLRDG